MKVLKKNIGSTKKTEKVKFNARQSKTSDKKTSDREDYRESSNTGDVIVSNSGSHTFGWSGAHLMHKEKDSSHKKHKSKENVTGVHGVAKKSKIKVDRQMSDAIF